MTKSKKADKHIWVQTILGILLILGILVGAIKVVVPLIEEWTAEEDFVIQIEPSSIPLNYEGDFPIKIIVEGLEEHNITSFSLKKSDITITRINNKQNLPVSEGSQLRDWSSSSRGDYVFNENSRIRVGSTRKLEAETKMWGCPNCFIGESSPYQFKLVVYYSTNGVEQGPYTETIVLPLVN